MDIVILSTSSGNKEEWNKFILENKGLFLQSWEWGEFQEKTGKKIWRLGDGENWAALVIKHDLPFGKSYLYCPGGLVANEKVKIQNEKPQLKIRSFLEIVEEIAKKKKSIFLKIEPMWAINIWFVGLPAVSPTSKYWENAGFIKSSGIQRIEETLVLDLTKSEEQLLEEMKQKTRYNIRLAEKQGVRIRISANPGKDVDDFYKLMQETAERNKIRIHSQEYYLAQMSMDKKQIGTENGLGADFKLFLAEYNNKIIAANIVVFFGNRAIYLHGGSSNESRNLMAPYLLQWEQIKEAKKRGCEVYDFWGIDEEKWPGITRFKKGFGGKEILYIESFDFVFQPSWYQFYKLAKKFKF